MAAAGGPVNGLEGWVSLLSRLCAGIYQDKEIRHAKLVHQEAPGGVGRWHILLGHSRPEKRAEALRILRLPVSPHAAAAVRMAG
jgi:hypothetical protein